MGLDVNRQFPTIDPGSIGSSIELRRRIPPFTSPLSPARNGKLNPRLILGTKSKFHTAKNANPLPHTHDFSLAFLSLARPYPDKHQAGLRMGMMLSFLYICVASYRLVFETPDESGKAAALKTVGIQGITFIVSFLGVRTAPKPPKKNLRNEDFAAVAERKGK